MITLILFLSLLMDPIPPDWFCKADCPEEKCFAVSLAATQTEAYNQALNDCNALCKCRKFCVVTECRELK